MLARIMGLSKNRHGVFEFRKVIPPELRARIGKTEIRISLRTRDEREALRKLPAEEAKVAERLRAAAGAVVLSPIECQAVADRWLRAELARDEAERRAADFPLSEGADEGVSRFDVEADLILDDARDGDYSRIASLVRAVLKAENLDIPEGSRSWDRLRDAMSAAKVRALREQHRRATGNWKGSPSIEAVQRTPAADTPGAGLTLDTLFAKWLAERKPRPRTELEWRTAIGRFKQVNGDIAVHAINKRHVVALKEAMVAKGLKPATVEKQLNALKALFQYGIRNALLEINPAAGIGVLDPEAAREKRLPFSVADLQAIFTSPVFSTGDRPNASGGPAAYWLPVLGLYTGARLAELAQLTKSDVRQEGDVWFIDVHDRDEGRRIKNKGARRRIPVHPELIRLGFLRYVDSLDDGAKLFPLLKAVKGTPAALWSKWFGRYLRKIVKITDRRLVFHSFRHTFKDACRSAEIPEEVHDALTGHAGGGVGRIYGRGNQLERLAKAIATIRYPGVVIPEYR